MAEKKLKLIAQRIENSKVKCKCDFYGRGLALLLQSLEPIANAENAAVDPGVYRQWMIPTKCKCRLTDHLRISFGKCELNPKNIALWAKAKEEAARKDTEDNKQI